MDAIGVPDLSQTLFDALRRYGRRLSDASLRLHVMWFDCTLQVCNRLRSTRSLNNKLMIAESTAQARQDAVSDHRQHLRNPQGVG